MPSNTTNLSGSHSTHPRIVLDSPAAVTAGTAFLAAGWHVDAPLARAAFAGQNPALMQIPVRLDITFDQTSDANRTETFTFASVKELVSTLSSTSGQELLTGIATFATGEVRAAIVIGTDLQAANAPFTATSLSSPAIHFDKTAAD